MSPDIEAAASLLQNNKILSVCKSYMEGYNAKKGASQLVSCLFDEEINL